MSASTSHWEMYDRPESKVELYVVSGVCTSPLLEHPHDLPDPPMKWSSLATMGAEQLPLEIHGPRGVKTLPFV